MRILFVAFSESIHTARWLKQIPRNNATVHLFPSIDQGVNHKELQDVTVHHSYYGKHKEWPYPSNIRKKGINVGANIIGTVLRAVSHKLDPTYREKQLARVIKKFKPDLIHSLEIQHGGYLVNEVRKKWKGVFPKWMVTNWGSDIYLFGQLKEHKDKIRDTLEHCDYYSCECHRDIKLAEEFGFKGKTMPVVPNTGGLDLKEAQKLRTPGKTSERRTIAVKGYQNWAGRALIALRALERCADVLDGYEVVIYSAIPENSGIDMAAKLLTSRTGIPVSILPPRTSHKEILRLHGRSRISIGLSISDGVSTSFLEALAMGSFPIQSDTACADEWIKCGKTGLLVPAEDVEVIEKNLRIALGDDKLVDTAAKENWETTEKRLDQKIITNKVKGMYNV